jgi:hypothetical protein
MNLDQIAAAISGGSWIGKPGSTPPGYTPVNNFVQDAATTGYLPCDGVASVTVNGTPTNFMLPGMPFTHVQPTVVDVHIYPCVAGSPVCQPDDANAMVQNEAALDFSDLLTYFQLLNLPSTTPLVLGETHSSTRNGQTTCEGAPPNAPAETVAGFNHSIFHGNGLSVVFRPWMQMQAPVGDCFTYPSNQLVNSQGMGPYTPTQQ